MKCVAALEEPRLVCVGYGDNPCCRQHVGCDAVCIEQSEKPRIYLVEIKRGRFRDDDAKKAVKQLQHCLDNSALPGDYEILCVVIANSYTHNAIEVLKHEASKLRRRTKVIRKKIADNDPLTKLVLEVAK